MGDRGIMGKRTLELLESLGLQYILGVRMRNMKNAPEIINNDTPYLSVEKKNNLKIKEVVLGDNRYIVCLKQEETKQDKAVRKAIEGGEAA